MRNAQLIVASLVLMLLLVACAPTAAPAQAPAPAPAAVPAPALATPAPVAAPRRAAWEVEWEKVLEAANKEGQLVIAVTAGKAAEKALSDGFKDKFGIRAEAVGGPGRDLFAKMISERRAGLYIWDAVVSGSGTLLTILKAGSATAPLEPALILPDLTDPEVIKKVWYGGKLSWVDQDHHMFPPLLSPDPSIAINTNLVKPGEIKTHDDLLNLKWKGKILFFDPTISGKGSSSLMPMLYEVKGENWVRKLAAQEPFIVRDDRLAMDWLAHAKYPIYYPPLQKTFEEFIQAGAPVAAAGSEDAETISAGASVVSLIDKAPHPNAAKAFINWYLSKEGQTAMSKAFVAQSARLDVPTDFLSSRSLRQPGVNYWLKEREEVLSRVPEYRKKSKEIFGHLIK